MEVVLGVSMTPTTVRVALVEGVKADGVLVEQDVFGITADDGSAGSSPSDQVIAVILGTQEGARTAGHLLASTGVAWSDRTDATALREALLARGLEDVLLMSELHAAAALAQAVGRTLAYDKTALMFVEGDAVTLASVESVDGAVPKVLDQSRYSADAIAAVAGMVPRLEAEEPQPQGLFVVGSGVDVTPVKAHLTSLLLSLPVIASEEPQQALARGAALASANAPRFDTSTVGLAYSQDSGTAVRPLALVDGTTGNLHQDATTDAGAESDDVPGGGKPMLLVGSTLAIFTVGVTALAIAAAVSIQPTVDRVPGEVATVPNEAVPRPAIPPTAVPAEPRQAPMPPKAAITTARRMDPAAPPPRPVFVGDSAPAPAAPPPAPVVAPPPPPPMPIIQLPIPIPPILNPPAFIPPAVPWPPQFKVPKKAPWDIGGKGRGHGR
jgi:hypothetical protein